MGASVPFAFRLPLDLKRAIEAERVRRSAAAGVQVSLPQVLVSLLREALKAREGGEG